MVTAQFTICCTAAVSAVLIARTTAAVLFSLASALWAAENWATILRPWAVDIWATIRLTAILGTPPGWPSWSWDS